MTSSTAVTGKQVARSKENARRDKLNEQCLDGVPVAKMQQLLEMFGPGVVSAERGRWRRGIHTRKNWLLTMWRSWLSRLWIDNRCGACNECRRRGPSGQRCEGRKAN